MPPASRRPKRSRPLDERLRRARSRLPAARRDAPPGAPRDARAARAVRSSAPFSSTTSSRYVAGDERAGERRRSGRAPSSSRPDTSKASQRASPGGLRATVEPWRVVGQRRAIPEQIAASRTSRCRDRRSQWCAVGVQREVQPVGMPVAAAVAAALEARVARRRRAGSPAPGARAAPARVPTAPAPAGSAGAISSSAHQERSRAGAWPAGGGSPGLVQVGVEALRLAAARRGVELAEPAPEIGRRRRPAARAPTSHSSRYIGCASDIPNRESLRAGKVWSGSAVSAGARSAASSRAASRRILQQIHAGLAGPAHRGELAPEREQVVVLALVPHPVVAEAPDQVGEHAGRALRPRGRRAPRPRTRRRWRRARRCARSAGWRTPRRTRR